MISNLQESLQPLLSCLYRPLHSHFPLRCRLRETRRAYQMVLFTVAMGHCQQTSCLTLCLEELMKGPRCPYQDCLLFLPGGHPEDMKL